MVIKFVNSSFVINDMRIKSKKVLFYFSNKKIHERGGCFKFFNYIMGEFETRIFLTFFLSISKLDNK